MAEEKNPTWKVLPRLRSNARDGGQHFSDHAENADAARSAKIEARGFQVLRFGNHDVMTNRVGILETIAAAVAERAPTLTLPRRRGRGQEKQSS
jgi:hypothetical protein